jgi:putative PEP-CTERM system TPR-repeat lipoprotein
MPNLNKFSHTIRYFFLLSTFLTIAACGQEKSEQQMLLDAKSYLNKGDPAAASIELRNTLQKNNESAEAHYLLGNIHLILGNIAIAEKEFNRAIQTGWDQEQTYFALARTYITAKKFQKLLDDIPFQETWSADTKANITALRALATAGLNQASPAKTALSKAYNYKKDALEVFKTTAIFQLSGLQDGNASETLKLALSSYPENSKILLLLAASHMQNKELSAATEIYRKVLKIEPANLITTSVHEARIGLARLQTAAKKLDQASATLAPLLKSNEKNPEANHLSGLISFSKKDYNHAEGYIRNLLTVLPNHHPSQLLMGKIKYALKEFEQASHHISLYLKAIPDDLSAQILLTQIYIDLAQPNRALSTLQPILKHNPKNTSALALQSQIAFLNNNVDKGIETLEKALQITPNDSALQKQLVKAYIATGKTTKALQKLKTFKSLNSDTQTSDTQTSQKLTISAYLAAGEINQALKIASQMLNADPDDPTTLALNGSLHVAKNDLSLARKYFNQARQQQKDLPAAIIGLAHLEEQEGNIDQAITLYKTLIKSDQAGTMPMLALSKLAGKQNRTNDMLSWLEKARASTPADLKSRLILANYYLHQSQPNKAETYIKEALKISPENIEVMTIYGRVLIAQKRYNEALPTLKNLAKKHPDSSIPHLLLGEAFSQLGMVKKARHHLQIVLKTQPDNIFASVFMAETEFKSGNYNNSIKYAKNLQKTQPKLLTGYLLEGNIWLARKNHNKAYSAYNLAWKKQQTADLAKKLFATSKPSTPFEKTVKPLLTWLEQHPEDYNTRLFLATAYQSKKHNDEAIREYESILKQSPDVSSALNNLAWLYSLDNNSKALDMAERAYRLAPENPGIQDTYGWILSKQGQPEKGLRLLEQALQILPDNPDIRFHYANALIQSGKKTRGKQVLKEILNQNKTFESREQAQNLLQTISD